ncbi:hypothetical protein [Xanthomonas axonopodis]|uniref:hypothetical protein n=1 Tax=Xanthomonas axonopodis TaxID=53413 RepID=UPI003557C741
MNARRWSCGRSVIARRTAAGILHIACAHLVIGIEFFAGCHARPTLVTLHHLIRNATPSPHVISQRRMRANRRDCQYANAAEDAAISLPRLSRMRQGCMVAAVYPRD